MKMALRERRKGRKSEREKGRVGLRRWMPSSPPRHVASSPRIMRATYSRLRWKAPGNFPSILIKSPRAPPSRKTAPPFKVNFHDPRGRLDQAGEMPTKRERRRGNRINIIIIVNKMAERAIHVHVIMIANDKKVEIPLLNC